jgi:hypothetical protein
MNASPDFTLARLRGLVLVVAWLVTPLMGTMPGAAHAAVTGTVFSWGYNEDGQIPTPAELRDVRAIAAGGWHTLALRSDGTVAAWGRNYEEQANVPEGLRDVTAIAAGAYHSAALKRDGTVVLKSSYRFDRFRAPVDASPVINTLQAGMAVPVKFSLGGNKGLAIFADGYPTSRKVWWCRPDAVTDEIEQTVPASSSSLRYDVNTDAYTYVWKTDPSWAGQCHKLTLRFADGIEHTALFRFR